MSTISPKAVVREHLARLGIKPKKGLGQNFLVNPGVTKKVVAAAELTEADTVVEIGPGLGTLTEELAKSAGKIVAVEIDRNLITILKRAFREYRSVCFVEGDALEEDINTLVAEAGGAFPYKVVANLPYYITTPLLLRFISGGLKTSLLVLMVQKEVALRLVAGPGTKEYGSISVLVGYKTRPELVAMVSRGSFFPAPEVDSAIVRLEVRSRPPVVVPDEELLFRVVRGAFGQRRKTLLNALAGSGLGLSREALKALLVQAGIDPGRRGETLNLEEFSAVARSLSRGEV
ncbi:MAG: 16S rRNA (adenine(1518)-N(6)/adenine(1519)-N(6))-dimethyltransferase RsmA [Bacillota bacterium]